MDYHSSLGDSVTKELIIEKYYAFIECKMQLLTDEEYAPNLKTNFSQYSDGVIYRNNLEAEGHSSSSYLVQRDYILE